MKSCRCTVEGKVQGVGYRFWATRTANSLNITGWVRNLPDGSVELLASGTSEALAALQEQLHIGPPYCKVTKISCVPLPQPDIPFSDFSIHY